MYRIVCLLACVLGLVSLNGVCEDAVDAEEDPGEPIAVYINEPERVWVMLFANSKLIYTDGKNDLHGHYTRVEGKEVKAEFSVIGEKVVRSFAITEKGLRSPTGIELEFTDFEQMQAQDEALTKRIIAKENAYTKVGLNVLGDRLGTQFKGEKLVVLMPAYSGDADRDTFQMDALKAGIDGRLTVEVVKIGRTEEELDESALIMGPESLVWAADFNVAMAKHKDTRVFLSLVGLPIDFAEMHFWTVEDDERPKLALANANIYMLRKAIQKEFVAVVLHHNPDAIYDPNAEFPEDPKEAFNDRYLLIDKDNVDAIAEKYPELFKAEPKKR